MNEREFADLAAGHALNALSDEDERAYQEAVQGNPHWDHHIRDASAAVAAIGDLVEPVEPPAAIRAALFARISASREDAVAEASDSSSDAEDFAAAGPAPVVSVSRQDAAPADSPSRVWGPRRWFTLAASIVAVLALGFGAVSVGQYLTRPAAVVALEQIVQAPDAQSASATMPDGGVATAHWSATTGKSVLVTDGMPTLPSDKSYELWFVRGETPIAAGVFETDPDGRATAVLDGQFHSGDVIAVTVEQAGGSPDGKPTSTPVVVVATA